MKKYLVVLLMIALGNALLADDSSPSSDPIVSNDQIAPQIRMMTREEFEGKVPIVIKVHEQLMIPIAYKLAILSNNPKIIYRSSDEDVVDVIAGGADFDPSISLFHVNLLCLGKQPGHAIVQLGEEETTIREFPIQVVE